MSRLNFEGRRKPECTDVVIAAHAMRENHYATLVHSFENFLRSQNYKMRITLLSKSNMSWKELPQSTHKNSDYV